MNAKFARNGIVMLVLIVGTLALLWTWLSSTTPSNTIGYSQFLSDVQNNLVTKVEQQQSTLTVTKQDGTTYTVTVPTVLTPVYADMRRGRQGRQQHAPREHLRREGGPRHVLARDPHHRAAAADRDRRVHPVHDAPGPGHE